MRHIAIICHVSTVSANVEQNMVYSESSKSIISIGDPSAVYENEIKSTYSLRLKFTKQNTTTASNIEQNALHLLENRKLKLQRI